MASSTSPTSTLSSAKVVRAPATAGVRREPGCSTSPQIAGPRPPRGRAATVRRRRTTRRPEPYWSMGRSRSTCSTSTPTPGPAFPGSGTLRSGLGTRCTATRPAPLTRPAGSSGSSAAGKSWCGT
jgi:hypothetical protein